MASFRTYSTGSATLDAMLGGGCRAGTLTEFYGRSNSGKTQIAMQTALVAARAGVASLFVDTEGSFRPERMDGIARARGWQVDDLLERVVYVRSDSAPEQMETVRRMERRPATSGCRLVVIDTLTRNFTVELPGRANMASRQAALDIHLSEMARDAYINDRAYLLTNRVTFGTGQDVGIGGRTVEQLVHSEVSLQRTGDVIRAVLGRTGRRADLSVGPEGIV